MSAIISPPRTHSFAKSNRIIQMHFKDLLSSACFLIMSCNNLPVSSLHTFCQNRINSVMMLNWSSSFAIGKSAFLFPGVKFVLLFCSCRLEQMTLQAWTANVLQSTRCCRLSVALRFQSLREARILSQFLRTILNTYILDRSMSTEGGRAMALSKVRKKTDDTETRWSIVCSTPSDYSWSQSCNSSSIGERIIVPDYMGEMETSRSLRGYIFEDPSLDRRVSSQNT